MGQNVFEMLGVEKRELSYSNFLAWLMDPEVNGEISTEFLKQILDLVNSEYTLSDSSLKVDREVEKPNSIADIVVENDEFQLVLENKVKSGEGKEQTERVYYDWKGSGKVENFVYLTPEYREECNCDEFEHITYTQIRDILEDMDRAALDKRTEIMIEDFIETLEVNKLVEFDGLSKDSIEYLKRTIEIQDEKNEWQKEIKQFIKAIEKGLKDKLEDEDKWQFEKGSSNIKVSKKDWEGVIYRCAVNYSQIKKEEIRLDIKAKTKVENRKEKFANFCEFYNGKEKTESETYWIKKRKKDYFNRLINGDNGLQEDIVKELYQLIEETEETIESALKE